MNTTDPATTPAHGHLPIGSVARRTGLSVSAIRYYSDEGIVEPVRVTDGGHRLYDVDAIARLEFIRTLRDLDAGLDQVRRVLAGATSLGDLLAEHLDLIEARTEELQIKRAVLRALVRGESTATRAELLQKLVTMSDLDRCRLLDEFWDEVAQGLPERIIAQLHGARPQLPADPSPEQLDAWITLAELLGDADFRRETRTYLQNTYATGPGEQISTPQVQSFIGSAGSALTPRLLAAHQAGLAPHDPHVAGLAAQLIQQTAEATGSVVDDAMRARMADGFREIATVLGDALADPEYVATHARYLELVAIINGEPNPDDELLGAIEGEADGSGGAGMDLRDLGPWLAAALMSSASTSFETA